MAMNQQVESLCIWMKVDWPRLCRVHTAIPTAGSVAKVFMMMGHCQGADQGHGCHGWIDFTERWAF